MNTLVGGDLDKVATLSQKFTELRLEAVSLGTAVALTPNSINIDRGNYDASLTITNERVPNRRKRSHPPP